MIGRRFTAAKRQVAMFCVALCVALAAQMTMVVLDRLKHVFQIEHAPTSLAGAVFDHAHHLPVDIQHSSYGSHAPDHHHATVPGHDHYGDDAAGHSHHTHDAVHLADSRHGHEHEDESPSGFHTHDWLPQGQGHDHGPITHHHHGSGMLAPWLVSATIQIALLPVPAVISEYHPKGHPDAPSWRRDRPPKTGLERVV